MGFFLTVLTKDAVREAELSGAGVSVPAAIAGVDLVTASGLRRPGPVVPEPGPEQVPNGPEQVCDSIKELAFDLADPLEGQHKAKDGCKFELHDVCVLSGSKLATGTVSQSFNSFVDYLLSLLSSCYGKHRMAYMATPTVHRLFACATRRIAYAAYL